MEHDVELLLVGNLMIVVVLVGLMSRLGIVDLV